MSALLLLMLQLSLVLAAAKACGAVLRRLGQPPVIGEMAGGLLLGPLAFGAWLPHAHAAVFPADSLPVLSGLGTLGVALFMFIMGTELRAPDGTRAQLRAAVSIGGVGIAAPLALGLAVAPALYPRFAPDGVGYWPFALFVAAAISVTAFPVLARILRDRGLARSTPGRLALGAGLVNDAVVWIFLAAVLAVAGGGSGRAVAATAAGAVVLAGVAFRWLRPLYARLLRPAAGDGAPSSSALVPVLLGLLGCAAFSEWIGLHAIFGAFVFGACLPRDDRILAWCVRAIEPLAIGLLMPVMFAVAGQHATPEAFGAMGAGVFALLLAVAISGKLAGCAAGARLCGHGWRDSLAVGALMNARGLMELIVIRIGYDAGLIGPELFTMLFALTLVTTVMASPLLSLLYRGTPWPAPAAAIAPERNA